MDKVERIKKIIIEVVNKQNERKTHSIIRFLLRRRHRLRPV